MATQSELISILVALEFVVMGAILLIVDSQAVWSILPVFLFFAFALYAYFS